MEKHIIGDNNLNEYIRKIYLEEQLSIANETLKGFTADEQKLVFEFCKLRYPQEFKTINESKWYNVIGDVVGIFDPTGIVDFVNGMSYWKQGDKLYAVLSWISALPGMDVVAKPVMGILKVGGKTGNLLRTAFKTGNVTKLGLLGKSSVAIGALIGMVSKWGGKLVTVLEKLGSKSRFAKRIAKTVRGIVGLFTGANSEMKKTPAPSVIKKDIQTQVGGVDPLESMFKMMFT